MAKWFLYAMLCILLAMVFPLLSFYFIRRTKKIETETKESPNYSELKASLLYLQTMFPTILFLLGALGLTTYKDVVDNVTNKVKSEVYQIIKKDTVEAWTNSIAMYRERAKNDAESIEAIATANQDSIGRIALKSFLKLLPKGSIVPFKGRRDAIDFEYWAICDGTKGTPDLTERFILGGNFVQLGGRGGTSSHTHKASTIPRGQVSKRQPLEFQHYDGSAKQFPVERHEHSFNGIESPVSVAKTEHLPPYYRLVFLMKIK